MKVLENINPALTSDILEKFGFHFDGYYNVRLGVVFKFRNDQEKGFIPVFDDPGLPPFEKGLQTYSDFIAFMHQALQMQVMVDMQKNAIQNNDVNKHIAKLVHDWFGNDKDLQFIVVANPQGIAVIPNDEYTFSVVNGSIHKFIVRYDMNGTQMDDVTIECSPQCISWPFMINYIKEVREIPEGADLKIVNCRIITDNTENPFFGIGIPKVRTK